MTPPNDPDRLHVEAAAAGFATAAAYVDALARFWRDDLARCMKVTYDVRHHGAKHVCHRRLAHELPHRDWEDGGYEWTECQPYRPEHV